MVRQGNLDILIATISGGRLYHHLFTALCHVEIGCQSGTEGLVQGTSCNVLALGAIGIDVVFLIALEARIELLGITDDNHIAFLQVACGDGDLRHSHHVDTHIIDKGVLIGAVRRHDALCCECLTHLHRFVVACHEVEVHPITLCDNLCWLPCVVIETNTFPTIHSSLIISIISLTLEEAAKADRTVLVGLPCLRIGYHCLLRTIIVGDDELHEQCLVVAKEIVVAGGEGHVACKPSRTQLGTNGVVAVLQHARNIESVVAHGLTVLTVARSKPVVSHALTIDEELVSTHSRSIELGLADFLALRGGKLCAQHGHGTMRRIGMSDEHLAAVVADGDGIATYLDAWQCAEYAVVTGIESHVIDSLSTVLYLVVSIFHC